MTPKEKILIADDSLSVLEYTSMVVEIMGYEVIKATNGREALEKARAANPDLILLDWKMPLMDGLEALIAIRTDNQLKDTPIIMITGSDLASEILTNAFECGVNDFLRKPFDKIELQARIKSQLKQAAYRKEVIGLKNNELINMATQLSGLTKFSTKMSEKLHNLENQTAPDIIKNAVNDIRNDLKIFQTINPLGKIQKQFDKVNSSFRKNILQAHPDLTAAELKLGMLLRLNMGTKEIAALLSQSYDSVRVARTRLRSKLQLDSGDNLINYILQF